MFNLTNAATHTLHPVQYNKIHQGALCASIIYPFHLVHSLLRNKGACRRIQTIANTVALIYPRTHNLREAEIWMCASSSRLDGRRSAGRVHTVYASKIRRKPQTSKVNHAPPLNQHLPLLRWKQRAPLGQT